MLVYSLFIHTICGEYFNEVLNRLVFYWNLCSKYIDKLVNNGIKNGKYGSKINIRHAEEEKGILKG